ncbi:hypothetical protein FOA52_010697 [Chlamydomonas sp. UWO 241]|nr:hypothetical protein FOA52_010697 [Chlamydomonas sp. UWO 241]
MCSRSPLMPLPLLCPHPRKKQMTFDNNAYNLTDIASWNSSDFWSYVGDEVIPRSAASIAFLAVAVVALLAYCLWRIVRCSVLMCCNKKEYTAKDGTYRVLTSRTMFWLKVTAIVMTLGVIGAAIAGLVLSNPSGGDVMRKAWVSFTTVRDYVAQLCDSLDTVDNTVVNVSGTANDLVARFEDVGQGGLVASLSSLGTELDSTAGTMRSAVDDLYVLVDKYDVVYESHYDLTVQYWDAFTLALQIIFGLTIGFSVVLAVALWLNWGWGIGIFVVLCLVCCILFFLLGAALGVLLVMISDVCPSAEGIIVSVAPTTEAKAVVRYYINEQSDPLVADSLLSSSGVFNLTDVTVALPGVLRNASDTLEVSGLPPALRTEVRGLLDKVNASATTLLSSAADATAYLSLPTLQNVYGSTKTEVCCTLPGAAAALWSVSTAIGWLLLGVIGMAFGAQALLDKTATQGRCFSCACIDAGSATGGTRGNAKPSAVGDFGTAAPSDTMPAGRSGRLNGSAPGIRSCTYTAPPLVPQATYAGPPGRQESLKGGGASAYPAIPQV